MTWPAVWGPATVGTGYVPGEMLARAVADGAGQAWRFLGEWRTVRVRRECLWKLARPWKSERHWAPAMAEARRLGLRPPSSAASAVLAWLRRSGVAQRAPATLRYWDRAEVPGGWEAVRHRGLVIGPIYWYDLRSAYAWAASRPLPQVRAIRRDDDWSASRGLWILRSPWSGDPRPYREMAWRVITWEERDWWSMRRPDVPVIGLTWPDQSECSLADRFAALAAEAPAMWDLGRRGFWGGWASRWGPEQVSLRSGESRKLVNPYANPVWAALVTARVRLRCAEHWDACVQVYVDAIWCRRELPTGEAPGDWRLLGVFRELRIRAPGVWQGVDLTGGSHRRHIGMPRGGRHGEAA